MVMQIRTVNHNGNNSKFITTSDYGFFTGMCFRDSGLYD